MQKSINDKYSSANLILKENAEYGTVLVGDCNSPVDKHVLKPHKVQTIITIGQDALPQKKQQNIKYIFYHVLDNKSQKIIELLDEVFDAIDDGRKRGGVLVHCYTGISRSPSFVIAYIMRKKFINYDEAKTYVKKFRPVAHPNDNFHRQLQNYWKILLKRDEQERLKNEKQKEKETSEINPNCSEVTLTNTSSVSKKTVRGVKGAVKSAEKQEVQEGNLKVIEELQEKRSFQKGENQQIKSN